MSFGLTNDEIENSDQIVLYILSKRDFFLLFVKIQQFPTNQSITFSGLIRLDSECGS